MSENRILTTALEDNMKDSYLRYSMSVIVSRALPDVRDGLKPVHRRVLFGMHEKGVYPGKPYMKSAKIVGEVMGNYHPHGDSSIYDTLVRMAQEFSLRYPLVDGQGNFGSIDGDPPAAMRYTEARMSRFAEMMLEDLGKDTVDFKPNYDDSLEEPSVLPTAFPNLLVNGSVGIAVGMATSMAPHNLREVTRAIQAVIHNPEIEIEELLNLVSGPDFPTGATICGTSGIRSAYLSGRGRVVVRAKHHVEPMGSGRERLVFTEIPYQVNKKTLLEKIGELIKEKRIEGISDLRDESDRTGMRIVAELKKDAVTDVVLNQLLRYTQLQDTFSIYNLALVNNQPKLLNLKDLIEHYIKHRHEVVVRRTQYELKKAEDRAHILEGLRIAQQNIDEVVKIIRASSNQSEARSNLEARYELSERQSDAIVSMRLGQLTALDIGKIENEYQDLLVSIADYKDILASHPRRMQIVEDALVAIADKFGDERRTAIEENFEDMDDEDLIPDDDMVITLSNTGYIKRVPLDTYRTQGRGGVGVSAANLKEEDFVSSLFFASNRTFLLVFTNRGRVHWLKVWQLPEASRTGRGKAIVNLLQLADGEEVSAIVPVKAFEAEHYLMMVTRQGIINKMEIALFSNPRRGGVNAINLDDGDALVSVLMADASENLMIATAHGQAITFPPDAFRPTGRGTRGVRGIRLEEDDVVIGFLHLSEGSRVLTLTENGYGKRTNPEDYRVTNRGGKGVRNIQVTDKTGKAVVVAAVTGDEDLVVTTRNGTLIRTRVGEISEYGRDAQGVKVIKLREGDAVMDATCVPAAEDEIVLAEPETTQE